MSSLGIRLGAVARGEVSAPPKRSRGRSLFWAPEVIERIEAAWLDDAETIQTIAARFALSTATLRRLARARRWPKRRAGARRAVWAGEELERIERAVRQAEATKQEIARRFRIGPMTLRALERAHGWAGVQGGRA